MIYFLVCDAVILNNADAVILCNAVQYSDPMSQSFFDLPTLRHRITMVIYFYIFSSLKKRDRMSQKAIFYYFFPNAKKLKKLAESLVRELLNNNNIL
jgi:hypothetical protein